MQAWSGGQVKMAWTIEKRLNVEDIINTSEHGFNRGEYSIWSKIESEEATILRDTYKIFFFSIKHEAANWSWKNKYLLSFL